jgi:hypothetical protein
MENWFPSFFKKPTVTESTATDTTSTDTTSTKSINKEPTKEELEKAARMEIFNKAKEEGKEQEIKRLEEENKQFDEKMAFVKKLMEVFYPKVFQERINQNKLEVPYELSFEQKQQIITLLQIYDIDTIIRLLGKNNDDQQKIQSLISSFKRAIPSNDTDMLFLNTGIRESQFSQIIPHIRSFLESFSNDYKKKLALEGISEGVAEINKNSSRGGKRRTKHKKSKKRKLHKNITKKHKNQLSRKSCNNK